MGSFGFDGNPASIWPSTHYPYRRLVRLPLYGLPIRRGWIRLGGWRTASTAVIGRKLLQGAPWPEGIRYHSARRNGLLPALRHLYVHGGARPILIGRVSGGQSHRHGNLAIRWDLVRPQLRRCALCRVEPNPSNRLRLGSRKPLHAEACRFPRETRMTCLSRNYHSRTTLGALSNDQIGKQPTMLLTLGLFRNGEHVFSETRR